MIQPAFSLHLSSDSICVLYAPDTGKIVFTHRVATLGDEPAPSEQELEQQARALASTPSALHDVSRESASLAALVLPSQRFLPRHSFHINLQTRELIATPRQP